MIFKLFLNQQAIESFTEVDYLVVRLYLTMLNERQFSRTSVARKISSLRSFYHFLIREGVISDNPFTYVSHAKKRSQASKVFL